ncbi:50S ribosomal protein L6 [Candidatus Nomurabacteria bacterium]|nr:50S ribosomal protein L6 [Candidatus Nomurabacteria bacterium]
MSRLGKQPITIPAGVTATLDGGMLTIKGSKGELTRPFKTDIVAITIDGATITVTPQKEDLFTKGLWGTYASHIINMIVGVTEGYSKVLEIEGVGFRWEVKGSEIHIQAGFSHPVVIAIPEGITATAEKQQLTIAGIDKELVGSFAADIRAKKKPEPYKGKGIRYQGEYIRRKQGKKSA